MAKKIKSTSKKKENVTGEDLKKKKVAKEDFESNLEKFLMPKPKKQGS